jgi:hypothetical protein
MTRRRVMTSPARLGAVAVVGVSLLHYIPPGYGEPFDWDRYHARQDACLEKDRIVADCVRGLDYCDELALRQAQRACSPFSGIQKRR